MQRIFGDFQERLDKIDEIRLEFSPTKNSIPKHWLNNGLTADFLANYWVNATEAYDHYSAERFNEITQSIGYITNELLENGLKYGYPQPHHYFQLRFCLYKKHHQFYLRNSLNPNHIDKFQAMIQTLLTEDPVELQMHRIRNQLRTGSRTSGLGFLTMINGYQARLAWKFEAIDPAVYVTTMVELAL